MKKYISISFMALFSMSLMTSCDKDTEGMTWITYYPSLELEGEQYILWDQGVPYVDPGYSAENNGKDLTAEVQLSSQLDYSSPQPGFYSINYFVSNDEGNVATAVRYVLVTDPNDPVSGFYYTDPSSYREYNGAAVYFGNSFLITVYGIGENVYAVSDLIGGWYAQRAGYGSNYAMQGQISVEDGVVSMVKSYVPGWSDSATAMTDGTFDEATGTLSWVVEYTDYPFYFHVSMAK